MREFGKEDIGFISGINMGASILLGFLGQFVSQGHLLLTCLVKLDIVMSFRFFRKNAPDVRLLFITLFLIRFSYSFEFFSFFCGFIDHEILSIEF